MGIVTPLASSHFPVKSLGLASDEHAFVIKGKERPAIVLAGGQNRWPTSPTEQIYICVPLYTVDKPKIPQRFVVEVQAFKHPGMFYLPESVLHRVEENVARFTLMQIAHGHATRAFLAGGKPVMLSTEFFGLLKSHLVKYLGGIVPPEDAGYLQAFGEIVLEQARAQGLK